MCADFERGKVKLKKALAKEVNFSGPELLQVVPVLGNPAFVLDQQPAQRNKATTVAHIKAKTASFAVIEWRDKVIAVHGCEMMIEFLLREHCRVVSTVGNWTFELGALCCFVSCCCLGLQRYWRWRDGLLTVG
jgi:hypothetical protein